MVIIPLELSEKSNEAWSAPRLTQQFVRWLFSLFDFIDTVMLLEILLIQIKCLKKRKRVFCGSCDTGAFWYQPRRKLKKGFITIKQENTQYIRRYICYFTYPYVATTINAQYGLPFSPHAAPVVPAARGPQDPCPALLCSGGCHTRTRGFQWERGSWNSGTWALTGVCFLTPRASRQMENIQGQMHRLWSTLRSCQQAAHRGCAQPCTRSGTFWNTMVSLEGPSHCQMLFACVTWVPES